jgi:hypothetical protein
MGVFLFLCVNAPRDMQRSSPVNLLPSLAELEKLRFDALGAFPPGFPSYTDLRGALELLENYHHGATLLSESHPPSRSGGGAIVYDHASAAVVLIQSPVRFKDGCPSMWASGAKPD